MQMAWVKRRAKKAAANAAAKVRRWIKERQITVSAWLRNNLSETLAADL
jgi:hypothetical protein